MAEGDRWRSMSHLTAESLDGIMATASPYLADLSLDLHTSTNFLCAPSFSWMLAEIKGDAQFGRAPTDPSIHQRGQT